MSKRLKRGYTTGVHASFAFKSAIYAFLATSYKTLSTTYKMDNDDLDVTKGCEIMVTISDKKEDLEINSIEHKPYIFGSMRLYAGIGVGVVTKEGLKPPKGYPAINPTPLNAIQNIYHRCDHHIIRQNRPIYATISIPKGEEIAQKTANSKVGIMGGLSILGTTGFVKPISAIAYIKSIETELNFAHKNGYNTVVLTLGNSSLLYAKELYNQEQIVEIGNFVYDTFKIVEKIGIPRAIFICGIGKATKVMQGFKNTHNRFGSINFVALQKKIRDELGVEIDIEVTKTVKGILRQLDKDAFYWMVKREAKRELEVWFEGVSLDVEILR
jgi:cobalt-precorrin-5B (C1)-methyltransferase